jgi:hypothetical protein
VNPVQTFVVGIAPDHVPALVAAILLPIVVLVVRRLRGPAIPGGASEDPAVRPARDPVRVWVAWLMGISAAVHLALPLGHFDGLLLTLGFVGSGAAYAWLALRAWEGRSYRLWSSLLVVATLIAYLVVLGSGEEEPDQVGIATALVELAALGLCLIPLRGPVKAKRFKRFAGSSAMISATFVVGVAIWVGSLAAHSAANANVTTDAADAAVAHGDDHNHAHEHAARAQAGIIMRPQAASQPTADQVAAAQALADATKASLARYARLDDALAAGYVLPANHTGTDVHVDNPAYKKDGKILDPTRPETLVYVIGGGKATLLGAMFQMQWAGVPGPQPGGPITQWHAHNICVSVLPPGFGIVSPFGNCPGLSLALTSPEMMHVWIVDNPNGPFAEGLDATWERAYNAEHGLPFA